MQGLLRLSATIDSVTTWIGQKVSWLILAAIIVSSGNAIIRKAFDMSSNAWLELQWYLFGGAFFLAAAYTLKQNEHIRIDIVYGLWTRRTQHWIDLLGHALFLMPFVILMLYLLFPYVMLAVRSGEMSSNAGGLPIWPAKLIVLLGFILLFIQGISEIIKKIAIMQGIIEDPNPFISAHQAAELEGEALAKEVGGELRK
jgi:TRAP-type mannitol/chloroaromatic compound transport system permease small subunit